MEISCYLADFANKIITFTNERTVIETDGNTVPARTEHSTVLDGTGHGTVDLPVWPAGGAVYQVRVAGRYDLGSIVISADGPTDLATLLDLAGIDVPTVSLLEARVAALEAGGGGGGGVTDGDKGDIVVSGSGTVWSFDSTVVTAAGRALLDDASASAQRTTLGLGTAATANSTAFESAGAVATHAALTSGAHGITAAGAALTTAANASAQRSVLGLGTAATTASSDYATAAALTAETGARQTADATLQTNIDGKASPADITSAVATHAADTTAVHGIADTAALVLTNDARLSDARTPTAHAASHISGADQLADATTTTHGLMSGADKSKLNGVAAGATANSSDATLLNRANHTGTQASSTISDFASASRAQTEAALIAGTNITITPSGTGATRQLTIAASGGGGGGGSYPTHATIWFSTATASGPQRIETLANQVYNVQVYQNGAAAMGDWIEATFLLAAGTYSFSVLGITEADAGMLDWTLDGTAIVTGQDWYTPSTVTNTIITVTGVAVATSGVHTLRATVGGKNAASSSYYHVLTSAWFKP